jgi:hypothetical protein
MHSTCRPLILRKLQAAHVAVDASTVATSLGSGSVDLGGTFAPFGDITESGFRLRVSGDYSWYSFTRAPLRQAMAQKAA